MLRGLIGIFQQQIGLAQLPEGLRHLRGDPAKDPAGGRGDIVAGIVHPGGGEGIVGIGAAPEEFPLIAQQEHHAGTAAGAQFVIFYRQQLQCAQCLIKQLQVLFLDFRAARLIVEQRQHLTALRRAGFHPGEPFAEFIEVVDLYGAVQLPLDPGFQLADPLADLLLQRLEAGLHLRFHRRQQQVDGGAGPAAGKGFIAAGQGVIDLAAEQVAHHGFRFFCRDHIPQLFEGQLRQRHHHLPTAAVLSDQILGLGNILQSGFRADIHTGGAAAAGGWIDRDGQHLAAPFLLAVRIVKKDGRAYNRKVLHFFLQQGKFLCQGLGLIFFRVHFLQQLPESFGKQIP